MVVLPYVKGLSEKAQRIFKRHKISTAMKPCSTLRQILVHPKEKRDINKVTNCVCEIPCQGCNSTYIGETGRNFGTRKGEHMKTVEKISRNRFTRANRKVSESTMLTSALADHVACNNHNIAWAESTILTTECDRYTRWVKEAIWIRRRGQHSMNRVDGTFKLSHLYDGLIAGNKRINSSRHKGKKPTVVDCVNGASDQQEVHHLADEESRT